jgi:hypothetical protein
LWYKNGRQRWRKAIDKLKRDGTWHGVAAHDRGRNSVPRSSREFATGRVRLSAAQCERLVAFDAILGIAIPAHLHLTHGTLAPIIHSHHGQRCWLWLGIVEIDDGPIRQIAHQSSRWSSHQFKAHNETVLSRIRHIQLEGQQQQQHNEAQQRRPQRDTPHICADDDDNDNDHCKRSLLYKSLMSNQQGTIGWICCWGIRTQ